MLTASSFIIWVSVFIYCYIVILLSILIYHLSIWNHRFIIVTSYKNYKVKYCTSSSPLVEAYLVNSTYCINTTSSEDETIVSSSFINIEGTSNCEKIEGGVYDTFDKDNYIRELGGYIFNAGYGANYEDEQITKASVDIMNHKLNSHAGKITLSIGNKVTFEKIKTILKF